MRLPEGVSDPRPLSGGSINEAWRVCLDDGGKAFLKMRADAPAGEYVREAAGLRWLAQTDALKVPRVLGVSDHHLLLQWINPGTLSPDGEVELGRGLAKLHQAGAPCFGDPGLEGSAALGSLQLSNEPSSDWPSFYAQRRLRPLAAIALERGSISSRCASAVERVCERIAELSGPAEPPARLHGDLWGGNVLADADGHPWLIDPSVYGGHREIDLAMLRLFGGTSGRVFESYKEITPLAQGWAERVELWQLAPLLVHAALFGGSYGSSAERNALRYL